MPFRQPLITAVLVVALLLALGCRADAKIVEKDNLRLGSALLELIEQSSQNFDRQAFLVIDLGAASMSIRSAVSSSDSIQHPELVQNAIQAMGWDDVTVEWSTDQGYSVARSRVGKGKLFVREAETTHKVGLLLKAFEDAGFTPVADVGVLDYAETVGHQPESQRKHFSTARIGRVAEDYEITVHGEAGIIHYVALVAIGLLPLAASVILIVLAVRIARDESIAEHVRRRFLQNRIGTAAIVLSMLFLMASFFVITESLRIVRLADLCFGSVSLRPLAPFILMPLILPLITGGMLMIIERRFIGADQALQSLPPEVLAKMRKNRQTAVVVTLLLTALIVVVQIVLSRYLAWAITAVLATLVLPFLSSYLSERLEHGPEELTTAEHTNGLYRRADYLARMLGVPFKGFEIDESAEGRMYVQTSRGTRGEIRTSRRAIEIMTPEEIDFLIASELAVPRISSALRAIIMLPTTAIIIIMLFRREWIASPTLSFLPLLLLVFVVLHIRLILKGSLHDRQAAALRVTGSLLAAESALLKMMKYGPEPEIDEDVDSHPKLAARVEYLRRKSGK